MSGQSAPRVKTSPKQGPLKATIPLSSVTKEGSGLRRSTSPNIARPIMDCGLGRRSPGASPCKGDGFKSNSSIRRTASLDTVYLKGLFPRESVFWHMDRATQTDFSTSLDSLQSLVSSDIVENRLARLSVRQRRRSCSRESSTDDQVTSSSQTRCTSSPIFKGPGLPPKSSRSSEEGLNQEIESYISRSESDPHCDRLKEPTPEGRKAPIADILLRNGPFVTRPAFSGPDIQNSSGESQGSSPDQDNIISSMATLRINNFSSRAPPDGCERILSKSVPILKPIPVEVSHPRSLFTLKPSSHSAFESLQRDLEARQLEQQKRDETDSPIVPDQQDLN